MWFVECPKCHGTGFTVPEGGNTPEPCPRCLGTGKIDVHAEHQRLLEEEEESNS